jgi:Uma2 family endonuclease
VPFARISASRACATSSGSTVIAFQRRIRWMTEAAVKRWDWTVEPYYQAFEAGVFGPESRVELIDGEVFKVPAMLEGPATTVERLVDLLSDHLERVEWRIRSQMPVHLDDISEPEPDVCVARRSAGGYGPHPEPSDLVLVIEVSNTSLAFDRNVKLPKYARSGIAEVWIVSLPEQVIHRFTRPRPASATYDVAAVFERGSRITATTLTLDLSVDDILPAV